MEILDQRLINVLCSQLGIKPEEIKPESNIYSDLGADSLDAIELIMAFEAEFGINIPDDELIGLHTVSEINKYLKNKSWS